MENIHDPEITEVEESLLRVRIKDDKLKVHIWREQTSDIPDTPDLKLLLFSEPDEARMRSMLEEKGSTPRVHRNTIFFLVPMSNERPAFANLVRKHLAFKGLSDDQTLKLTADQNKEIKDSLKRLDGDLSEGVRRLYRQLYLPARTGWKEIDLGLPTVGDNRSLDQEVYDRLRMDGEILERIAPLVIKEKYLKDRDWVSTSQLYQASLKTPGEARALNQSAWDAGIAEGVRKGLFGLGELKDDQPICRYYKEEPSISFTDAEILIKAEVCEKQWAEREKETHYPPGTPPPGGKVEDKPETPQPPGTPPGIPPVTGKYQQLSLKFIVPKGKVASLMGVLNYLQSRYNRLELSVNVGEGQLTEQEYEDKVKEAFRQMGIEIG